MERVRQLTKVDELLEQERVVTLSMSNRAGVLGVLLHSTFNHELDNRYKATEQQRAQLAHLAAKENAKQAAQMIAAKQAKVVANQQAVAKQSGTTVGQNVVVNVVQNQQQTHHVQQQQHYERSEYYVDWKF
jgi:AAA+ superfamily predicted ATPase